MQHKRFKWTPERDALLQVALEKTPKGHSGRWHKVGQAVGCSDKEAERRTKELNNKAKQEIQTVPLVVEARTEHDLTQRAIQPSLETQETPTAKQKGTSENNADWSTAEQKALERGLKLFPSSDPERWNRIADVVGSRTKRECKARYKSIVEALKAKKAD